MRVCWAALSLLLPLCTLTALGEEAPKAAADSSSSSSEEDSSKAIAICGDTQICECNAREVVCDNARVPSGTPGKVNILSTIHVKTPPKFDPDTAYFRDNHISSLTKEEMPSGMDKLTHLDLQRNRIKTIDNSAFDTFKDLRKLILRSNSLPTIKRKWFDGLDDSLHYLDLSKNTIGKTDKKPFTSLKNLRELILDGNSMELDQDTFNGLENLRDLSLDDIDLDDAVDIDIFKPLKNLEALSLQDNKFTRVPEFFKYLPKLKRVDLSGNRIISVTSADFDNLGTLETILLENTALESLESCAFCNMVALKEISFKNSSKLAKVDANAFGFSDMSDERDSKIEKVSFENTAITSVDSDLLPWNNLTDLNLVGIPLACSCEAAVLLKNNLTRLHNSPRCATPSKFEHRELFTLKRGELCDGVDGGDDEVPGARRRNGFGCERRASRRFSSFTALIIFLAFVIGGVVVYSIRTKGLAPTLSAPLEWRERVERWWSTRSPVTLPTALNGTQTYSNIRDTDGDCLELVEAQQEEPVSDFEPRPIAV